MGEGPTFPAAPASHMTRTRVRAGPHPCAAESSSSRYVVTGVLVNAAQQKRKRQLLFADNITVYLEHMK